MNLLQSLALAGYRAARRSGLISTGPGAALYFLLYGLYKRLLEAPAVHRLCALVPPGGLVIDVGANVGFFTKRFAQAVGPRGSVIALEPEPKNFARLARVMQPFGSRVTLLQAAAADSSGQARLALNLDNPADHRLAEEGIAVAAVRLDDVLAARGWPPVSLIKVDVQGAEPLVLAGAEEIVRRFRPALFVEIDIETSVDQGRAITFLLHDLEARGYRGHRLMPSGPAPLSIDAMIAIARRRGYADFLLLAQDQPGEVAEPSAG